MTISNDRTSGATITRIGRYDVVGELGRGGMGVVYRGEDKLIGRDVAIKTLTEVTPELRQRFYVEARSGILSHPNIVTVYEVGEHEGNPFIAMEFVAGESLEKILRSGRRLALLETLSVIEQLCAGLGYAHQHGVLHRDVKPANVILQPDGRTKIVDFGIALLDDQSTRLTKTNALIGSFHYLAPERLKGEMCDGRADLWSVGVMLYEMIAGELPFKGQDVSALYKMIHEPFAPLQNFVSNVPEPLTTVVERALAKRVEDRYATAEEMAFDLQEIGDALKKEGVEELLDSARRLTAESEFASARTLLLKVQRIDPRNTDVQRMMREVQERLSQLQRNEQLQQIVEQAEEALSAQRFDDAVTFFRQAVALDPENTLGLVAKLEDAQDSKERQDRARALLQQATIARGRGDLTKAQEFLGEAMRLDGKSTDLRSAYAVLLREVERRNQESMINSLLKSAQEEYSVRRYTEAITRLREAAEIDPVHPEVQKLLFDAMAGQEKDRRRRLMEQIVITIQDCLDRDDFERALDQVNRVLEKLPLEATLLRMKAEIEKKKRDFKAQELVRSIARSAQELLYEEPHRAMTLVDDGLQQVPGDQVLLGLRSRLKEHLRRMQQDEARAECLHLAHTEIAAGRFEEAIRVLETAPLDASGAEELELLLSFARGEQQLAVQRQRYAELREEAQHLLHARRFGEAISMLEPIATASDDLSIRQLLEEAKQGFRETSQRAAQLLLRARDMAETDPEAAQLLLNEQPEEMLARDEIAALKDVLAHRIEISKAIRDAVTQSDRALAAGKLDDCMEALDHVRRAYGDSGELETAVKTCTQQRKMMATALLNTSIDAARRALLRGEPRVAVSELREAGHASVHAGEQIVETWERLVKEAAEAAGMKTRTKAHAIIVKERSKAGVYATVGAVGLSLAGGVWWMRRAPQPVPSAPLPAVIVTYINLNASPWARVLKITGEGGRRLEEQTGEHVTPMRLESLPTGHYDITFAGPDNKQQVKSCEITLEQHLCAATFDEPDVKQLLAGEQR